MKKHLQNVRRVFLLAGAIMLTGGMGFAQSVVVAPGPGTLQQAALDNPGDTLILQRGQYYIVDEAVGIDVPTVIIGEAGPVDQAPPVIQFFANPGEADDKYQFAVGANTTFKNIGFMGYTAAAEAIRQFILVTERDVELTVDNCVFQSYRFSIWTGGKANVYLTIKNCTWFNNSIDGWDNSNGYGPLWGGDSITVDIYNNTYFTGGRIFGNAGSGPNGSQLMNHNTYVNTFGDCFFPSKDKDFVLKNSIFFNAQFRGYVGLRTAGQDTLWTGDYSDWVEEGDSLCGDFAIFPHSLDTVAVAGVTRNIEVTNNLKMYEQRVLDWYEENNVTPMTFFNVHGWIYADRYGWTIENNILQEDGNTVNPDFAMGVIPEDAFTMMKQQRLERSVPPEMQGEDFPYDLGWRPGGEVKGQFIWPLPFDFKPTNTAVLDAGDDGYPLGDLNWFGPEVVAAWEAGETNPIGIKKNKTVDLSLMNYPNPFSSMTQIRYNLLESSQVIVKIYDVAGAEVATLVNDAQIAGMHEIMFDGTSLAGGIYFCKLKAGNGYQVRKMSIIK